MLPLSNSSAGVLPKLGSPPRSVPCLAMDGKVTFMHLCIFDYMHRDSPYKTNMSVRQWLYRRRAVPCQCRMTPVGFAAGHTISAAVAWAAPAVSV